MSVGVPRLDRWFLWAIACLALSFVLFALPTEIEGPVLVRISPEHAIAVLDLLAIVPLVGGASLLYAGLWRRRARLIDLARRSPGRAAGLLSGGGFGLGLLLASVYSGFVWWWAIGAVLLTVCVVTAAAQAAGR